LGKIYNIDAETLKSILPYCKVSLPKDKFSGASFTKKKELSIININTADTTQLKALRGIGSKLSARIVKYRDNIGGFHSIDQLHEIYGLKTEVIDNIKNQLVVEGELKKIDINAIVKDSLVKHFYFDYKLVNAIINYRYHNGHFHSVKELKNIKLISETEFDKIAPYILIKT